MSLLSMDKDGWIGPKLITSVLEVLHFPENIQRFLGSRER